MSFAELGLRPVQELKDQFGVTVNDVVLAVCSGALRAHLAEHGQETGEPLVAIVPVSVRGQSEGDGPGNRLSAMFVPLANDRAGPLDRLATMASTSAAAKAQERAVGFGPVAAAVSEAVPPALARPVIRLGIQSGALRRLRAGNVVISNVPGPNFSLFFAGMRMVAVYPLGPVVDGVALNITVQSYADKLFVGINACATAVPDLPALALLMEAELGHLTQAAAALLPGSARRAGSPPPHRRRAAREPVGATA